MPVKKHAGAFGDLHVTVNVDFPKALTASQRAGMCVWVGDAVFAALCVCADARGVFVCVWQW